MCSLLSHRVLLFNPFVQALPSVGVLHEENTARETRPESSLLYRGYARPLCGRIIKEADSATPVCDLNPTKDNKMPTFGGRILWKATAHRYDGGNATTRQTFDKVDWSIGNHHPIESMILSQ